MWAKMSVELHDTILSKVVTVSVMQNKNVVYFSDFSRKYTIKFNDLNIVSKKRKFWGIIILSNRSKIL